MNLQRPRRRSAVVIAAVVFVGTGLALASFADRTDPMNQQDPAPIGSASMRATIDPETGALVVGHGSIDSQQLELEMQNTLSRSTEGLEEVHHPDGRVSVNLQGRFQSATVARINAEGKAEITCVDSHDSAQAFRCDHQHQTPIAEER